MEILVLNCGSSSIKADVLNPETGKKSLSLRIQRLLSDKPLANFSDELNTRILDVPGHGPALEIMLPEIAKKLGDSAIKAVGHRVVHGGEKFGDPVLIDEKVEQTIEELIPIAPLHNPINLIGIREAKKAFPQLPHVAVFDTAFHQTLPHRAQAYALPREITEKHGFRRYGFHGTSHAYVAKKAAEFLGQDLRELRLITVHLGSGCSITAVEYGRSVETSMGLTPLEGLVMGTRPGDLDPGLLLEWMRREELSVDEAEVILNRDSGLKGLSGVGNDMRDIVEKAGEGDEACRMALHVFSHRVRKYIGAYAAVMGGVDAIIFTAGIGENSPVVRHRCCQRLDYLGARIDEDKNRSLELSAEEPVIPFSLPYSKTALLAVATDEQLEIAQQTESIAQHLHEVSQSERPIPIAISARHIHLTQETVEALFGKGYQLTERNPLSQPGQFACNETVDLVGPKRTLERVRILGPTRSKNQVEVSRTDEFFLGVDAPVRESGKTENTPGIRLVGPEGTVDLKEGLICAWRHIHMTPDDAEHFGVVDRDIVEVEVQSGDRSLTFGNVLIRVSSKYKLEMHIDTDEGNAAEIGRAAMGALRSTEGAAALKRKKV